MPNDLIGDLSKIRLFDLIKPLVEGKKSGMVVIEGTNAAELYIEGGSIVHGKTDTVAGEDAISAIMDLNDGRVTFNWRMSPEKRTVSSSTEQLMSNWAQQEEEWRKITEVVPTSDAVFSIVVDSGGDDRTIPNRHWGVLALCNGMRSVSDIAGLLGRSVFEVSKAIHEMVCKGALEKAEVAGTPKKTLLKGPIDEAFFVSAETELKKVLGPIARIIMSDTLAAFEESRDAFPKSRAESFIETICDQIADEQKRERFGKAMYVAWLSSLENG
jgi:hypothetical protein